MVRRGEASPGMARRGSVGLGLVGYGTVRLGTFPVFVDEVVTQGV